METCCTGIRGAVTRGEGGCNVCMGGVMEKGIGIKEELGGSDGRMGMW